MHLFDAGTYSRHENSEWVIKLDDFWRGVANVKSFGTKRSAFSIKSGLILRQTMRKGLEGNQKICNMQFYLAISWHNKFWVEIASCIKSSANIEHSV